MNVLFLNTLYFPDHEELIRLENIQREITSWRVDLHREWHNRRFTQGEKYLSWLNFHNGIRRHWKIYITTNNSSLQDDPLGIA
jgi:hypothetical protein